jgi:hypothetical protein
MTDDPFWVISLQLQDLEWRECRERRALFADHNARFRAEREALAAACVAVGGHDWRTLPNNGINAPHFITGEWPMWCPWCGTHRPFGWTREGT